MYFEGNPLVIFITPLYYLPPQLIIVPWGHACEGQHNLLAPPYVTLWSLVIFYVVRPSSGISSDAPPSICELIHVRCT